MKNNIQIGYTIPDDYEFVEVKDGKVYIKYKTLPKTWKECINLLVKTKEKYSKKTAIAEYIGSASDICFLSAHGIIGEEHQRNTLPNNLGNPMLALCQLLICREAYRDGWKPDWNSSTPKFCIYIQCGNRIKVEQTNNIPHVLSFNSNIVTEKFIKNFKDLILEASELLL